MKTLVLTERGEVVRRRYQDRLGHAPPVFAAMSDEDAATLVEILAGRPRRPSCASSVSAVSEPFTRTRLSANGSSRPRATPSSTVVAAV